MPDIVNTLQRPSTLAITSLNWANPWLRLPDEFYSVVALTPLEQPYWVLGNSVAVNVLGLSMQELVNDASLIWFNGETLTPQITPVASVYAGHQFGIYTSQLGDGRAILFGEVENPQGQRYEIQVKGAGLTPYSRTLDGRCPLASALREYLGSVALAGLDIPTIQAVGVIGSRSLIQRDQAKTAALLLRMAKSHVRFGHFEFFHHKDQPEQVKILFDFVIEQVFPELLNEAEAQRPLCLLETVTARTAGLIAAWQSVGFTHGVMNTDNMTLTGDTLDFGPFGFMESYDPAFTPNSGDELNRYQYDQQPEIGRWNCLAFAVALTSLLPGQIVPAQVLRVYRHQYQRNYLDRMRLKLGLEVSHPDDAQLVAALLTSMHKGRVDYPLFFYFLAEFDPDGNHSNLLALSVEPATLLAWLARYSQRLSLEKKSQRERQFLMNQVNPVHILRRELLDNAIADAERGDFKEFKGLCSLLQHPFVS